MAFNLEGSGNDAGRGFLDHRRHSNYFSKVLDGPHYSSAQNCAWRPQACAAAPLARDVL